MAASSVPGNGEGSGGVGEVPPARGYLLDQVLERAKLSGEIATFK